MPLPPKKPQRMHRVPPGAARPGEKGKKPPVKKPPVKKPFDRFRWEFYGGAILAILLVALPVNSYVKGIILAVIAAMVSDFAWNSPLAMQWTRDRKLRRWGAAIVVLALVGWGSIRMQYGKDKKQRVREPMAQLLAEGTKLQEACLSSNSGDAGTAAAAWSEKTGKWLAENAGSVQASRFNNPTGQILPGNRYNAGQQRCWSYVSLRMLALKEIANEIEDQ